MEREREKERERSYDLDELDFVLGFLSNSGSTFFLKDLTPLKQ